MEVLYVPNVWMDVWMYGWMYGWMDGCIDVWMYVIMRREPNQSTPGRFPSPDRLRGSPGYQIYHPCALHVESNKEE